MHHPLYSVNFFTNSVTNLLSIKYQFLIWYRNTLDVISSRYRLTYDKYFSSSIQKFFFFEYPLVLRKTQSRDLYIVSTMINSDQDHYSFKVNLNLCIFLYCKCFQIEIKDSNILMNNNFYIIFLSRHIENWSFGFLSLSSVIPVDVELRMSWEFLCHDDDHECMDQEHRVYSNIFCSKMSENNCFEDHFKRNT